MRRTSIAVLGLGLALLIVAPVVRADVIFDSLTQAVFYSDPTPQWALAICQGFLVPSDDTYWLRDVVLSMAAGTSGGPGAFSASLWDSTGAGGTAPGNEVATLVGSVAQSVGDPSNPYVAGLYTYGTPTPVALDPSTTYYVVITATGGSYRWNWITDSAPAIGSGNVGNSADGIVWDMYTAEPYSMRVDAQAPEPGTIALLLMGLPVGMLLRRRRR